MAPHWAVQRIRRDLATLAYVTVPFLALAATFLAIGKLGAGGWDALDYLIYAMATGVLWAGFVVCYLAWVLIRDGWQPSSYPAAAVLAALVLLAAGWAYRESAEDAECNAQQAFFLELPSLSATERTAAIGNGERFVRSGSDCAIDGLRLALGSPAPDDGSPSPDRNAERRAILAELLEAGLPPDQRLLYGFAVSDADPASTRLLLRWRKLQTRRTGAQWPPFPDDIVRTLIGRARTMPGQAEDPAAARYRRTLAVFVEEASPDPQALSQWTRESLIGLGLLRD